MLHPIALKKYRVRLKRQKRYKISHHYALYKELHRKFNIRTCEHMILGQLRMGARQAKNAPLIEMIKISRVIDCKENFSTGKKVLHHRTISNSLKLIYCWLQSWEEFYNVTCCPYWSVCFPPSGNYPDVPALHFTVISAILILILLKVWRIFVESFTTLIWWTVWFCKQ